MCPHVHMSACVFCIVQPSVNSVNKAPDNVLYMLKTGNLKSYFILGHTQQDTLHYLFVLIWFLLCFHS